MKLLLEDIEAETDIDNSPACRFNNNDTLDAIFEEVKYNNLKENNFALH